MVDVAKYFIEKRVTSWMITFILLVGGAVAFTNLGRLEDPEFSIKQVNIFTSYPGATPEQVEDEVTYLLEAEMQNLPYVDQITSTSTAGMSELNVELKDTIPGDSLGQIWDEVRKKISDLEPYFPPGVGSPLVVDDFSDVYGILLAFTATEEGGYSYAELDSIVTDLSKELALVEGVSKVAVGGDQTEEIRIEVPTKNLVSMGIPIETIAAVLSSQNTVSSSGSITVGQEYIRLSPTGEFQSVDELGLLTITSENGNTVKLRDIATIERTYSEPATHIIQFDGKPAITLGVSFLPGVNVVEVGELVRAELESLSSMIPLGVEYNPIYFQSDEVANAVSGFLMSLVQAVGIVIVVLLVFMGLRSGILIGLILVITIFGTFIIMDMAGISLQRISLGGLIVSLGMLVDNAIVVVEGVLIGMKKGKTKLQAASDVVKQTKWPLLGATVVAITAFGPIGLSPDSIGEFVGSLFWVLLISLLISWFTAVALTPFFCDLMFKEGAAVVSDEEENDPYKGFIFTIYKKLLSAAMAHRWVSIVVLVGMLFGALWSFQFVKQAFFPASATPMFYVELRYPEGTSMETTTAKAAELGSFLSEDERVEFVASTINYGFSRFMLTYQSVEYGENNAQLVVRTHNRDEIPALLNDIDSYLSYEQPEVFFMTRRIQLGPASGSKLEVRFQGKDATVLRELAEEVKDIYRSNEYLSGVRDDWKQPVKVLQPVFDVEKGAELGITKSDFETALLTFAEGQTVGVYRDGTDLLPIKLTLPETERDGVDQLQNIQLYSNGRYINITEVTDGFNVVWENPTIEHRDRERTITAMADPALDSPYIADELFFQVKDAIDAIELPEGYTLTHGGEYESSAEARGNMARLAPMGYMFMLIITILLFNSFKEAAVVWLCVPLMLVGIVTGLLVLNIPFGFMGFIGLLSLTGMVVKNGIVLIDQVNVEINDGKDHYRAMYDAAISRLRPVMMAAVTTILGLLPLLADPFFQDMAVVISFGLGFATLLTLVAVPVFYVTFFKAKRTV
ncbi:efflux RND transporter permease subunit [Reinekea marinisedimentorum]|uniref:Multidrug efflux pump subunit AcrB n=1 Tax=Reinekea marinisedimentorum TaxID=230495 RepID=A0A4R3HX04_9GAMM|nr:efflux RND transporter permease subunit [Reinekea marinisedimentorum]TCS37692.1 multidrug efflux pump subunit AcrB [Reinekea marinisedimentorum]